MLQSSEMRNGLIDFLRERNIQSVFHYIPLHSSPMGERFGYREGELPVTEQVSACLLRLPCYYGLTEDEQDRVIEGVQAFLDQEAS